MGRLVLPYPPSMNHYWRHVGAVVKISGPGRAYRAEVADLVRREFGTTPPAADRLAVRLVAFPPDHRRRDLDNLLKPLLDALAHAGLYVDDSQIDWLLIERAEVVPRGGSIVVYIEPLRTGLLAWLRAAVEKLWSALIARS